MATRYVGLLKAGSTVVVELARSKDQLNCELWQYMGERITSAQGLRAKRRPLLALINTRYGKAFTRLTVREVRADDWSAGHSA